MDLVQILKAADPSAGIAATLGRIHTALTGIEGTIALTPGVVDWVKVKLYLTTIAGAVFLCCNEGFGVKDVKFPRQGKR